MNKSQLKRLGGLQVTAHASPSLTHIAGKLALLAATMLGFAALLGAGPASAEPIFKRGRPPIYPYFYSPPRHPGGYSFYFGFVPYQKGDYETQALQRQFPQMNYPPSMRYWTPNDGSPIP
jgi:hypothetical protein